MSQDLPRAWFLPQLHQLPRDRLSARRSRRSHAMVAGTGRCTHGCRGGGVGGRSEYFDSNSEETGADSHVGGPLTRKRTQEEGWLGLPFLCSEGKNSDRQMGNGLNHCTSIGWGGVQTSGTQIPLPLPSLKHEPSFTSWLQGGLLASLIPTHSAPTATVLQRPRRP